MTDIITAFILAGGIGSRIRSLDSTIPKPLFKVCGRPVLFRLIDGLRNHGIERIYIIAGHLSEILGTQISAEFGSSINIVVSPLAFPIWASSRPIFGKSFESALLASGSGRSSKLLRVCRISGSELPS